MSDLYLQIGLVFGSIFLIVGLSYYLYLLGYLFVTDKSHTTGLDILERRVDEYLPAGDIGGCIAVVVFASCVLVLVWLPAIIGALGCIPLYLARSIYRLNTKINKLTEK